MAYNLRSKITLTPKAEALLYTYSNGYAGVLEQIYINNSVLRGLNYYYRMETQQTLCFHLSFH